MPKPLEGAALYRQKENALEISLYNLQYGQTRDVFLVWPKELEKSNSASITISAALEYTGPGLGSQPAKITTEASSIPKNPNPAFAKYHLHRSMVCEFLNSLSKLDGDEEYITMPINDLDKALTRLDELIRKIKSSDCAGSGSQDFLYDLGSSLDEARANSSADPAGQVMQALFRPMYFDRWGKHYLPSLLHAYRHQLCLNEKDHGPKAFVATNPLFHHFKEAQSTSWDKAQDRLMEIVKKQARADAEAAARGEQQRSPPAYSFSSSRGLAAQPSSRVISMAAYNNPHNPCFAGPSRILLASGRRIPVRLLRRGAAILTPAGPRRVAAVVETALRSVALCELGELLVTPWHPVFDAQSAAWVFPATVAEARVRRGVKVYSVMLEEGRGPEAHAVDVGGYWTPVLD
ncbi:hypothetical protein DBV05_g3221 [Lasiodiplodia theobromae]|uniref:Uncharacterized protein n=1 Tax=Lasiodiplodia theobromae TaxID=45133 RepID=A0A5N5DLS1_9PEZI|nr:hypothetical protein DBV05_g3221 [Lasiodiplodia theobromae]